MKCFRPYTTPFYDTRYVNRLGKRLVVRRRPIGTPLTTSRFHMRVESATENLSYSQLQFRAYHWWEFNATCFIPFTLRASCLAKAKLRNTTPASGHDGEKKYRLASVFDSLYEAATSMYQNTDPLLKWTQCHHMKNATPTSDSASQDSVVFHQTRMRELTFDRFINCNWLVNYFQYRSWISWAPALSVEFETKN